MGRGACAPQDEAEDGDAQPAGPRQPTFWVRLDPGGDWLCAARVHQPEACWVAQLEKSRDVVAQSQAVAGLAVLANAGSQTAAAAVAALSACLRNPQVDAGADAALLPRCLSCEPGRSGRSGPLALGATSPLQRTERCDEDSCAAAKRGECAAGAPSQTLPATPPMQVYCRVRAEAAMALGMVAGAELAAPVLCG